MATKVVRVGKLSVHDSPDSSQDEYQVAKKSPAKVKTSSKRLTKAQKEAAWKSGVESSISGLGDSIKAISESLQIGMITQVIMKII